MQHETREFFPEQTTIQPCSQSPRVYSYVDGLLGEKDSKRVRDHIENCFSCQRTEQGAKLDIKTVDGLIPNRKINLKTQEEIVRELKEVCLFIEKRLDDHALPMGKRIKRKLKEIEKSLSAIIFSKDMVKYYMISVVMGATLKVLLNI